MTSTTASVNPQGIIQGLVDVAASQAVPGPIGSILKLIIDQLIFPTFLDGWLFPKPAANPFKQLEAQIEKFVEKEIETAVGQATFDRVKTRITGLADAFRGFADVVDYGERRTRLAYLLTLVDATVAEVEAVPDRYLYLLTDQLQTVAIMNIAVLLDQVKMYPDHYENQLALNQAAIRYSDLAGRIRDRFLWYRLGQIAEGTGLILETDVDTRQDFNQPAQKKVRFTAYDDFRFWQNDPYGYQSDILDGLTTDWVLAIGEDPNYYTMKQQAQAKVAAYGDAAKQEVYSWWDDHLTKTTQNFMQFVDWAGQKGDRKPKDRTIVQAYPLQQTTAVDNVTPQLDAIDLFLGQQMDQFSISGPRYAQTYRLPGTVRFGDQGNIFYRADTYDSSVAAIYFTLRGDLDRATDLADALCTAIEHDPVGGGRIVAATNALGVVAKDDNHETSVFYPDGGTRDIGNMCWAGLALTRLYAKTRRYRYLYNALVIGCWIRTNCAVNDAWQGFSGGEDAWGAKRLWRSVEHNVDAYALFRNLHALTQDAGWLDAANQAQTLVGACRVADGYYVTGTGNDQSLNSGVVPTDTQSWTALSGINPDGNAASLQYMVSNCATTSGGYVGFKFALGGSDVQNEVTAGAAMALYLQDGAFRDQAGAYYDSLANQQKSTGLGLLATPAAEADTGQGLGWKYFNWLHVASTAWMGLAFLARDNGYANPYATVQVDATS